jgi:hypothetical protein
MSGRYAPITAADNYFLGSDATLEFTVYDSNSTEETIKNGTATPQDISGWSFEYVVRRDPESINQTFRKTTDDDISVTDGPNGQVQVTIFDTDTRDLTAGVYYYTLRRNDPLFHNPVAFGEFVMLQGATR